MYIMYKVTVGTRLFKCATAHSVTHPVSAEIISGFSVCLTIMTSKFAAIILLVLVFVSGSEGWRRRRRLISPPTNVQTHEEELTLSALAQRSEKVGATGRGVAYVVLVAPHACMHVSFVHSYV